MAKYDVTFSCGHQNCIQLFGKVTERERKIAYFEEYGLCRKCYKEQKRVDDEVEAEKAGLVETEISYRDYKTNFPNYKAVPGSYNGRTKTIRAYIPKQ